jgi:hypothetical protein
MPRPSSAARLLPVLAGAILLAGCDEGDDSYLLDIDALGAASGQVYVDLLRTGSRTGGDPGIADLRVALVRAGTRDTLAYATSDAEGAFEAQDLPVGRFAAHVDRSILGDSLELVAAMDPGAEVRPGQIAQVSIGLSFHVRTVPEILGGPEGVRVFAQGVALNSAGNLPGAAVHVRSDGRALRITGVSASAFAPGDTVLILGRTLRVAGQMTMTEGTGRRFREGPGAAVPVPLSTAGASSAAGGPASADFVTVSNAEVLDVRTSFGELLVTVDDGSGPLLLRFPTGFLFELRVTEIPLGARLDVQGVLLRSPQGSSWDLRPRVPTDIMGLQPEL